MPVAEASRKLVEAPGLAAVGGLGFGAGSAGDDDDAVPWDVVVQRLAELLRFLASAVQALVAALREHADALVAALASLARAAVAIAVPAAAAVAVLLVLCGCCCVAAAQRRRRRGPDGEEVEEGVGGGDVDGPVVRCRGVYKGGIFSMHPNKPLVC